MDVCVITRTILFKGLSAQSIKSAFQISTRFDNCVISCSSLSQISLPAFTLQPTVKLWKFDMIWWHRLLLKNWNGAKRKNENFILMRFVKSGNQVWVYCLYVTIVFSFSRRKQEEWTLNNKIRNIINFSSADEFLWMCLVASYQLIFRSIIYWASAHNNTFGVGVCFCLRPTWRAVMCRLQRTELLNPIMAPVMN